MVESGHQAVIDPDDLAGDAQGSFYYPRLNGQPVAYGTAGATPVRSYSARMSIRRLRSASTDSSE